MKNIFENAYFGKAYKTRDGRKALYQQKDIDKPGSYVWIDDIDGIFYIGVDGFYLDNNKESKWDIVSEWEEDIDEEELDRLAYKKLLEEIKIAKQSESLGQCYGVDFVSGFKVGYKTAKKGE